MTTTNTKMETVLDEGGKLIRGAREKDYGHPKKNFKDIANLWSAYLSVINRTTVTPADVAMMMVLLKMARCAKQSMPVRDTRDSVVDMAGYVGILERLEELDVDLAGYPIEPNDWVIQYD